MKLRIVTAAIVVLLGLGILYIVMPPLPSETGGGDFFAYWSASYLLSRGRDFADDANLLEIEKEYTGWGGDIVLKTWNPPWVLAWLLPLILVEFRHAARLWFIINFFLLYISIASLWRLEITKPASRRWLWLAILIAVLFPSTLLVFLFGQMGIVVLASLVGFIVLYRASYDMVAGAVLSFAMVKPHLVFITVPLLLLVSAKERRWRVLLGFTLVLSLSSLAVLILRPESIDDYMSSTASSELLYWENPTLPAVLHLITGWLWFRLIGLVILPVAIYLWFSQEGRISLSNLVNISLLASIIAAPFAWSYDFVVLLLPMIRILLWMIEGAVSRLESALMAGALVILYGVYYYQRIQSPNEIYFAWVPLIIAGLYTWVWLRSRYI